MVCSVDLAAACAAGYPHPNLERGMREEHCEIYGHDEQFTSGNYGITTTPEKEYKIATGVVPCPEEETKDKEGRVVRVIKKIEDLQKLPMAIEAGRLYIEILAVVSDACLVLPSRTTIVLTTRVLLAAGALHRAYVPGAILQASL